MVTIAIQSKTLCLDMPRSHRVFLTLAFVAISFFSTATFANETPSSEDALKDWRYDQTYVEYWTRSWECFREQEYECAKQELAPLLDMKLTPEQNAQTRRTMVMSVVALANVAFWEKDYKAQIRHLEEAVKLDPRKLEVANYKLLIAQAYRLLEQWSECALHGEEAFNRDIELDQDLACFNAAFLAECQLKSDNPERAQHWVAESKRLAKELEEGWDIADSTTWEDLISRIEDALSNPPAHE